jgi:hypothetical protein
MTVKNKPMQSERKPVLTLVSCQEEDWNVIPCDEPLEQEPLHELDLQAESFWAGRNKAARLSARIAA